MGEDILRFAKDWEVFIYLILGIFVVWQIRKFALAWGELRSAAFGLERESAQGNLNWSISMLIIVFLIGYCARRIPHPHFYPGFVSITHNHP
jgi:hypothetical protein